MLYAYSQIHVIKYECTQQNGKRLLFQTSIICGKPILFQQHITCGGAQNVVPLSNTCPPHKLQIPLLQEHCASCSWAMCRPVEMSGEYVW